MLFSIVQVVVVLLAVIGAIGILAQLRVKWMRRRGGR